MEDKTQSSRVPLRGYYSTVASFSSKLKLKSTSFKSITQDIKASTVATTTSTIDSTATRSVLYSKPVNKEDGELVHMQVEFDVISGIKLLLIERLGVFSVVFLLCAIAFGAQQGVSGDGVSLKTIWVGLMLLMLGGALVIGSTVSWMRHQKCFVTSTHAVIYKEICWCWVTKQRIPLPQVQSIVVYQSFLQRCYNISTLNITIAASSPSNASQAPQTDANLYAVRNADTTRDYFICQRDALQSRVSTSRIVASKEIELETPQGNRLPPPSSPQADVDEMKTTLDHCLEQQEENNSTDT